MADNIRRMVLNLWWFWAVFMLSVATSVLQGKASEPTTPVETGASRQAVGADDGDLDGLHQQLKAALTIANDTQRVLSLVGIVETAFGRGSNVAEALFWQANQGRATLDSRVIIAFSTVDHRRVGRWLCERGLATDYFSHVFPDWRNNGETVESCEVWVTSLPLDCRVGIAAWLISNWHHHGRDAAVDWAIRMASAENAADYGPDVASRLARVWASVDLDAATVWAKERPQPAVRERAMVGIGATIAQQPLAAAMAWIDTLPASALKETCIDQLTPPARFEQGRRFAAWLVGLPATRARDTKISRSIARWAVADVRDVAAWTESLTDESLVNFIASQLAIEWQRTEPTVAGAWVLRVLGARYGMEHHVVTTALLNVAINWATRAPAAAASWTMELPPAHRHTVLKRVVEMWSYRDADAAAAWLENARPSDAVQIELDELDVLRRSSQFNAEP